MLITSTYLLEPQKYVSVLEDMYSGFLEVGTSLWRTGLTLSNSKQEKMNEKHQKDILYLLSCLLMEGGYKRRSEVTEGEETGSKWSPNAI